MGKEKEMDNAKKLATEASQIKDDFVKKIYSIINPEEPEIKQINNMKNSLTILLIALCGIIYGQTDTVSMSSSMFYVPSNTTGLITIADTVTVLDTLFIDGDTITDTPDSVVVLFTSRLAGGYSGFLTFTSDSIPDTLQGDVSLEIYQSACDDCPYVLITGTDKDHTSPPDEDFVFFQVRGLRLKILYYAVSGTSRLNAWILLKPSSLSNNASN